MNDMMSKNNEQQDVKKSKVTRKNAAFFALFLIGCATLIFFINEQKVGIPMRPVVDRERVRVPDEPKIDYRAIIQTYLQQAATRNMNAMKSFESDIYRINSLYERKFSQAAAKAAEDASGLGSCVYLTCYMAWDKVTGDHKSKEYIEEKIDPHMNSLAQDFTREINEAMQALNADLHRSTLLLAKDLYAEAKITEDQSSNIGDNKLNYQGEEMEVALRNLSINAISSTTFLAIDIAALWNSFIFRNILGSASKIFEGPITSISYSIVAMIADGPLPIGDIIALIGTSWTIYDIYSGRQEFEDDLRRSLDNSVADAVSSMHTESLRRASDLLKRYQSFQDKVGASALEALVGGGM